MPPTVPASRWRPHRVTVAALSIVDMIKGVDRTAAIRDCMIVAKSGGRSGDWQRPLDQLPEWAFED